jgi:hypothetical protein
MRWAFAALMVLHGVIHVMGFAKASGLADLTQLTASVTRGEGVAWLISACLFITTALLLTAGSRVWWVAGFTPVVLSQSVIVDPTIRWDPIDERSARGHYTVGPNTIRYAGRRPLASARGAFTYIELELLDRHTNEEVRQP